MWKWTYYTSDNPVVLELKLRTGMLHSVDTIHDGAMIYSRPKWKKQ